MKKRVLTLLLTVMFSPLYVLAEGEPHIELYQENALQVNLNKLHGKKVIILLKSGAELEGTIKEVGTRLLHMEKITNRAFYQGAIQISEISTLLFKDK